MATITKPNTFTPGTTIFAAEHNDNFDTIYNDYNGNITNVNVAAGAAIAESKLDFSATGHDHSDDTTDGQGINLAKAKIASEAQGDVFFRGSADWERLGVGTDGQCLTTQGASANPTWSGMTTQGDVEYHNGSDRTRLGPGTAEHVLTTKGAAANPVWQVAPGGAWKFVETLATTSGTSVVSATLPTDSDLFLVVIEDVGLDATGSTIQFRPNSNGSADKDYTTIINATVAQSTNKNSILLGASGNSTDGNSGFSGTMLVPRIERDSDGISFAIKTSYVGTTAGQNGAVIMAYWDSGGNVTTMQFLAISGASFDQGAIHIYKLVQ